VDRNRELIHSALVAEEYAEAQRRGSNMTIDQAIAFAENEF